MNRLTNRNSDGAWDVPLRNDDDGTYIPSQEIIDRLAAYEETGLEPEEVEAAKKIAARLALADYPHNFQRERTDIASYMYWITSVMKEAKAWWEKLLETRGDAEKSDSVRRRCVTPIKCTGLNCPMQVGKVDPATCKAADTCEWATKPLTNADGIRAMTDEELAEFRADILCEVIDKLNDKCYEKFKYSRDQFVKSYFDWLKQEVKDNEL